MPDEVPMVTSCPLCLAPDEVQSMVTIEIDRVIAGGRTSIIICRSCAGAVIDAIDKLEPPLLFDLLRACRSEAGVQLTSDTSSAAAADHGAFGDDPSWLESADLHAGEEPDDGTSTD